MSENTNEQEFDLADVLAVTTGKVVKRGQGFSSGDPTDKIVSLMTGSIIGHGDMNAETGSANRRKAAEAILEQHPELKSVDVSGLTPETAEGWLEAQRAKLGQTIKLTAKTE